MTDIDVTPRKPGRPKAIPEDRIEKVISWHQAGLGYSSISNELLNQGIYADRSTVRRVIKKWQIEKGHYNGPHSNSATILTRGILEN
jgi:transposase-like protein